MVMSRDPALERLFSQRLAVKRTAKAVGISTAAVAQWRKVPIKHVAKVAEALGVSVNEVRPDLHPEPADAA